MSIQRQIDTIKEEIGKPRSTRGRKVRDAAIRFEEHFRDQEFNSSQFQEWLNTEPDLNRLVASPSLARERLQAAGYRDDMPRPFKITHTAKSAWKLEPPEQIIFSGQIPEEIVAHFKKTERKLQKALQAIDLDDQDRFKQFTIVVFYREFKRCKELALVGVSGMQDVVLRITEGYLALEPPNRPEIE
jgi:hypothetical protein